MSLSDYERIERAITFLEENFREQPDLKDIAAHLHLSEFHFQRLFRRWAGISPKRFFAVLDRRTRQTPAQRIARLMCFIS